MNHSRALTEKFKDQMEILYTAHNLAFALRIWAKGEGWFGTNQWLDDWQMELLDEVNDGLKTMHDYFDMATEVPACPAVACNAKSLYDCFEQVRDAMEEAQMGWQGVAKMASDEGAMDVAEYPDKRMKGLRDDLKKMTRFLRYLKRSENDMAALMAFDKARG
jgi:ferritin